MCTHCTFKCLICAARCRTTILLLFFQPKCIQGLFLSHSLLVFPFSLSSPFSQHQQFSLIIHSLCQVCSLLPSLCMQVQTKHTSNKGWRQSWCLSNSTGHQIIMITNQKRYHKEELDQRYCHKTESLQTCQWLCEAVKTTVLLNQSELLDKFNFRPDDCPRYINRHQPKFKNTMHVCTKSHGCQDISLQHNHKCKPAGVGKSVDHQSHQDTLSVNH